MIIISSLFSSSSVAYINKKDYDSAIQQFLLVCEQRPSDANNFVNSFIIFKNIFDLFIFFRFFLKKPNKNKKVNVGVAYANKKDYKSALNSFEKALKLVLKKQKKNLIILNILFIF